MCTFHVLPMTTCLQSKDVHVNEWLWTALRCKQMVCVCVCVCVPCAVLVTSPATAGMESGTSTNSSNRFKVTKYLHLLPIYVYLQTCTSLISMVMTILGIQDEIFKSVLSANEQAEIDVASLVVTPMRHQQLAFQFSNSPSADPSPPVLQPWSEAHVSLIEWGQPDSSLGSEWR